MSAIDEIYRYMNIIARELSAFDTFDYPYNELATLANYDKIENTIEQLLNNAWNSDEFITEVETLCKKLDKSTKLQVRAICAHEICKFMDGKISYLANDDNDKFSVFNLVRGDISGTISIGAMNSNYAEVGIWINPKFPTVSAVDQETGSVRRITNKQPFYKMNNVFNHCSYFVYDGKRTVKNVIIPKPYGLVDGKSNFKTSDYIKVGFSPITNQVYIDVEHDSFYRNGSQVRGLFPKLSESYTETIIGNWEYACKNDVDILFMPEMLGDEKMTADDGEYNHTFYELSLDNKAPMITVLPSVWKDRVNSATIINEEGFVLGVKEKEVPFVKGKEIEALEQKDTYETVIIHIPEVHRITVLICSEFVLNNDDANALKDFIFENNMVTLVLVPSYTLGERDFINDLEAFKKYGVSIVWGNCCGAFDVTDDSRLKSEEKALGGVSLAGSAETHLFGEECKCGRECEKYTNCLYTVKVPVKLKYKKNNAGEESKIEHCLERKYHGKS